MPELELDTVFEAGELSTGDVIDSCSSASSHKNNNGGEEEKTEEKINIGYWRLNQIKDLVPGGKREPLY